MSEKPQKSPVWEQIRVGFRAEKTFASRRQKEVQNLAQHQYQIPQSHLATLTQRVLKAAIRTLRLHAWQPRLIERTVQSQALVFRWQQGKIMDTDIQRFKGIAGRYIRKHMGQNKGSGLTYNQQEVCDEAMDVFIQKVSKPGFVLTSALDTYLIGVVIRRIKAFYRYHQQGAPGNSFRKTDPVLWTKEPDDEIVKKIRFYRRAHRLVAHELGLMDDKCLHIILHHYGIDPNRLESDNAAIQSEEPLTQTEFDMLFNVSASEGPAGVSRKLKDIAPELGISPKKISQHHLACVDNLVQRVLPVLLAESDGAFAETVRQEMITRLAEARIRKQKK